MKLVRGLVTLEICVVLMKFKNKLEEISSWSIIGIGTRAANCQSNIGAAFIQQNVIVCLFNGFFSFSPFNYCYLLDHHENASSHQLFFLCCMIQNLLIFKFCSFLTPFFGLFDSFRNVFFYFLFSNCRFRS